MTTRVPLLEVEQANVLAQAARDCLEMGWQPIPIPARSKNPGRDDWQLERWTLADVAERFAASNNIGVLTGEPSHGLTDVDLDCEAAIRCAPFFLPETGFKSGRPSAERSHWWYVTSPVPESKKFRNVDGKCLLELRTNGMQTVIPPSLHQDTGEQLRWYNTTDAPATVAGDVLSRALQELAAATLLTHHYPKEGTRHEFALALSGFLLRQSGWDAVRTGKFVTAAATTAGDDEISDRETAVETTAACLAKGEPAKGGPTLRELLGNEVFQKFCEWLGFAKSARFDVLPTVEADDVAEDDIPNWPADTLEGDRISDLTFALYDGTSIPPHYIREQAIAILAARVDGRLGYPMHHDLPMRRFLALISERAGMGKGVSLKRLTESTGTGGALCPLLGTLKLLNGSGIGSGQYLAKILEENPDALCYWDESSQLFQVSGQQCCTLFSALKVLRIEHPLDGKLTNKKHGADDPHLSVLLHATRKTFLDGFALRGGVGDGLLSRFTLVYSAGMPGCRVGAAQLARRKKSSRNHRQPDS